MTQSDAEQATAFELDVDLRHLDLGLREPPAHTIAIGLRRAGADESLRSAAKLLLGDALQFGCGQADVGALLCQCESFGEVLRMKMADELKCDCDRHFLSGR